MSSPKRVLVLGTGTGIGKTYVTRALVHARANTLGLKPIESGAAAAQILVGRGSDAASLGSPSEIRSPYLFPEPVSPHLAARIAGVKIDLGVVSRWIDELASANPSSTLVVESAGGAFSPLGDDTFNADLIDACGFDAVVLVSANRLGVLHDVFSTWFAVQKRTSRTPDCVVLNDVYRDTADPLARSTNRSSLEELLRGPAIVEFPSDGSDTVAAEIWRALDGARSTRG